MKSQTVPASPKVEHGNQVTVVTLTGGSFRDRQNMLAGELGDGVGALRERHVLLDFGNVEYVNSIELGTLITLHKQLQAGGGMLTLFNVSSHVYEVLAITRLDSYLDICREAGEKVDHL